MIPERPFRDRSHAGQALAARLRGEYLGSDPLVLALPRGGVPVAAEIAGALHLPMEVFLVRKLGLPGQPELAMGAIASGGVELLDQKLIAEAGLSLTEVTAVIRREQRELERRERAYRPEGPLAIHAHSAIVVDDGLATGFTMRAAVTALRQMGCPRVIAAAPVGAKSTCRVLGGEVDLLVCPLQPEEFEAVGAWYQDFQPTSDEEVQACLTRTARPSVAPAGWMATPP
jgi:putative phosphoribosyl transferase